MPTKQRSFSWWTFGGAGLCAALAVAACSATNQGSTFGGGGAGSGAGAPGSGGDGSGGGLQTNVEIDAGSGSGGAAAGACAADKTKAEAAPLDIYIMLDQSASMSDAVANNATKWGAVTGALDAFVQNPGAGGISVGVQYFGLPPGGGAPKCGTTCQTDADCGDPSCGPCIGTAFGFPGICQGAAGGDSCNAADYAKPDVEIADLSQPGVAAAIIASIGKHSPSTNTPTAPALQGAIDHAKAWAQANPSHVVIDVLATDGEPTECDPQDIGPIEGIASAGASGSPKVLTFVIGVGSSLSNLNGIAQAGGTTSAFLVDTNQDVNKQFLAALAQIRGTALGCSYKIPVPQKGTPDFTKVNVQYTPGNGGKPVLFPNVANKADCPASGDGWYYDNPSTPTQIVLCDGTCKNVSADGKGEVDVLLGCSTVVK
jgi:hypothetical protein